MPRHRTSVLIKSTVPPPCSPLGAPLVKRYPENEGQVIRGKLAGTRVPRASTSLPKYLRRPLREPRLAKAKAACFRKQGELANAMELYRCPFHGEVDPGLEK